MFKGATSFNGDISKWDISSVNNMQNMFRNARSFKRKLCGARWVHSNAIKTTMFLGSLGSISGQVCPRNRAASRTVCTRTHPALQRNHNVGAEDFRIESKYDLKRQIDRYLERSAKGDCTDCPGGVIGDWDVSRVTDMSGLFSGANLFDGDISKWDVSRVTNMGRMFMGATSFQGDLSKWDVSSVTDMTNMFRDAKAFKGDISNWDVAKVQYMTGMFDGATAFEDTPECNANWAPSVNPFLDQDGLPRFETMRAPETITKYLDAAVTTALAEMDTKFSELEGRIRAKEVVSGPVIMDELERVSAKLSYAWGVAGHLISVRAR